MDPGRQTMNPVYDKLHPSPLVRVRYEFGSKKNMICIGNREKSTLSLLPMADHGVRVLPGYKISENNMIEVDRFVQFIIVVDVARLYIYVRIV